MQVIMYQANAFTDGLFEGSPIGIVPDAKDLTEENMKRIVKVTNLEKIAFIIAKKDECYDFRFFNSKEEVSYCDCATIASFYALAERGYIKGLENGVVRAYECTEIGQKPVDIYYKDGEVERVELCEQRPVLICDNLDLEKFSQAFNIESSDISIEGFDIKPEISGTETRELIIPVRSSEILDRIIIDIDNIKLDPMMKDIDKLYIFSIDDKQIINYASFEFKRNKSMRNEETTSNLMYYIKKNNLLNGEHYIYKNKSFKSQYNYMQCEILECKDEYPVKIGGKASIYLEGVVTFG